MSFAITFWVISKVLLIIYFDCLLIIEIFLLDHLLFDCLIYCRIVN